ncbi:hypothetical protein ABZ404_36955 [Streptomyces sp. NPDC005878]|uniref:hypothetical protein n=1 Tax=Streptomyces sp. NPDC005878 TaxID=3157077 RepID=UPI0033CEE0E2
MPVALTLAALAAGYLLGRTRPWDHLDTWVWRRIAFGGTWTQSRWQTYLTFAVHTVVRPRKTWNAWRHRHDAPKERPAPPLVRNLTTPNADDDVETT